MPKRRVYLHTVRDICPEFGNGKSGGIGRKLPWIQNVCGAPIGRSGHRFGSWGPRDGLRAIGAHCRLRHRTVRTASGTPPSIQTIHSSSHPFSLRKRSTVCVLEMIP